MYTTSSSVAPKAQNPAAAFRLCRWVITAAFGSPEEMKHTQLMHYMIREKKSVTRGTQPAWRHAKLQFKVPDSINDESARNCPRLPCEWPPSPSLWFKRYSSGHGGRRESLSRPVPCRFRSVLMDQWRPVETSFYCPSTEILWKFRRIHEKMKAVYFLKDMVFISKWDIDPKPWPGQPLF